MNQVGVPRSDALCIGNVSVTGGSVPLARTHAADRPATHTHALTKLVLRSVSLLTRTLAEYRALLFWRRPRLAQVQENAPKRALSSAILEEHAALVLYE